MQYMQLVVQEARLANLPPSLVAGLIDVESGWQPDVISDAGAVGLMQVMPGEIIPGRPSKEELLDPATNVRTGCQILGELMRARGNRAAALASYYGGIYLNRPTEDGWRYVNMVEGAALRYLSWDLAANSAFAEYAPGTHLWPEAAENLKGIATQALESGRALRDLLKRISDQALAGVADWGDM